MLSENILIKRVNEITATIEGSVHINANAKSIIEIGGQSAKYIAGFNSDDNDRLRISQSRQLKIETNTDCAAGTGSFLEEQASRLNIKIEDYAKIAENATDIPRIAGRCSVFAKTDIIHNQQEGVGPENILKGLAYAIAKNYKGSIIKRSPIVPPVLFIGGVAYNNSITKAFCDVLDIDSNDLMVPEYFDCITALGAALIAKQKHYKLDFSSIYSEFLLLNEISQEDNNKSTLNSLNSIPVVNISGKHDINLSIENKACLDCYLGIDIGSTSTNLVLTNKANDIVSYKYIRTAGEPLRAVFDGLNDIHLEFQDRIRICGVGVTGSGRKMIGDAIGADVIRDEITAQAKAAVTIDPEVDTIFEIGGQDSKYISLKNGSVVDFQMNKICAAGTGSFLEEQALKFDIPLEQFSDIALKGKNPVYLGERCTVFIESSIKSNLANGKNTEDIISGLCYSIAKNYLHRVVGQKKIGNKIFLQGGIAYNQGVLNAMQIITKKEIIVPPFFSVTGAFGAAILAKEEMYNGKTNFTGFDLISCFPKSLTKPIKIPKSKNENKYNSIIEKLIFEDHISKIDPARKTVGIPRALFTYGMFPMFNGIFKSMGFNVILSDWSDDETIKLGQEYALAETCFPVKLITGHVAELVQKGVDYIFFPDLYTVKHEDSKARKNYGCAYMQLAFKIVSQTMELDKKGIQLLAPTIAFNLGEEFMRNSFASLGDKLGKTPEETKIALQEGMKAYHRFEERIESSGKNILNSLDPNKITFVLISKTYGVSDPVLNLGIPAKLIDMGHQVLPFFNIPGENVGQEHPNMFWPFGEHILEPTYLIREHPNIYPILLTHHGCGPDSVLVHYFKELMGDKSFLNIEIDEHASKIGVETRLEAFVNSLSHKNVRSIQPLKHYQTKIKHTSPDIKAKLNQESIDDELYLPNLYPFSELICEYLKKNGYNVNVLPAANDESLSLGREFTRTNEYLSMTSLLGDCFKLVNDNDSCVSFLVPQTEGAELEGQYNRLLRTKLDECKLQNVNIISPFIEDFIKKDLTDIRLIFQILIAGDLINTAPYTKRSDLLFQVKKLIMWGELNSDNLKSLAGEIHESIGKSKLKRILAIGEPMVVLNDFLNDNSFRRIVYFSISEAMWMFWYDYISQNKEYDTIANQNKLFILRNELQAISKILKNNSPFSSSVTDLVLKADQTIGYYAGAFARYRFAKMLLPPANINGIITANSTYENTGVSLNILQKQHENEIKVPILNLNFDGDKTDYSRIETFIYYL